MSKPPIDLIDPFDDCEWLPAHDLFRRLGFEPVSPAGLDDFQLLGRLWEFIYALAGRRFYLHYTDHLGDRELYHWLYNQWLVEQVADIPPEAEWNCNVCVLDLGNGNDRDEQFWLRWYAGEKEREAWALENGRSSLPPHENPRYGRDRWLPGPPGIPQAANDEKLWFEDDEESGDEHDESDPLGLKKVDAEIETEKRRKELTVVADAGQSEDWQRPIDQLQKTEGSLLPPDELTDETLTAKLWELLHNLACRGFYVLHTDHLSDRELYAELWTRGLRDEALLPGKCKTGGWFHDFLGSWGEDEMQLWLRYYASEEDRAKHAKDWPKDTLPPKEQPLFNRDWRLPKGPF